MKVEIVISPTGYGPLPELVARVTCGFIKFQTIAFKIGSDKYFHPFDVLNVQHPRQIKQRELGSPGTDY